MSTLVFLVVMPLISAVLTSLFLGYLFYPLYRWTKKKIRNENAASLIITVVVIILLVVPLFLVLNTLTKEAYVNYLTSKQKLLNMGDLFKNCNPEKNSLCGLINYMGDFLNEPKVKYHLENNIEKISSYIIDGISNLIFSIPKFVLNFFVMVFTLFYLFKDGAKILNDLRRVLPLKDIYKRRLFEKFGEVIFAIVYGHLVVAVIQGILGGVGFFIFGVQSPVIWGIVMVFAALIPFLGTGIVWLPAALLKLFNGISTNNTGEIIGGVLFILYGIIIISSLDNVIRPKIIGEKARVHPVLVLIGVLGGVYFFGPIGIFVGPLVLALFVTFVRAYEEDVLIRKAK